MSDIPIVSNAVARCTGCGGLLFVNVFHICAANMSLHEGAISREVLTQIMATSFVPAPPEPSTSAMLTEPPTLNQTTSRTQCEACGEALSPSVMHRCHGNT